MFQQIYLQFGFDCICIFIISSDTLQVLMFVWPTVSELRFNGCCHPYLSLYFVHYDCQMTRTDICQRPRGSEKMEVRPTKFLFLWRRVDPPSFLDAYGPTNPTYKNECLITWILQQILCSVIKWNLRLTKTMTPLIYPLSPIPSLLLD